MHVTILREDANKQCETQIGDLHSYPRPTWKLRSGAEAHLWLSLDTGMTATVVFIYFSFYIISPQILLDGDNVHVHHASFTGL